MQRNKHTINQILMISIASICAFALIVGVAYFISVAIKGDFFNKGNAKQETSLNDQSYTGSIQNDQQSVGTNTAEHNRMAVDYVGYTVLDLMNDFDGKYQSLGFIDGGYTIYNYEVCPFMQFVVPTDGKGNIISGKIQAIMVTKGGRLIKDVVVGMTYNEMKNILGNQIHKSIPEENSLSAEIESGSYKIMINFEEEGLTSEIALIKPKIQ